MNRNTKRLYILFVSVLLVSPMVASLFGLDSPNYNRSSISNPPKLISSNQIDLRFTEKFDQYYTQNFNLRSFFVSLYHRLSMLIFNETGNDQVLLGDQSMLYFKETLNDYQRVSSLTKYDIQRLVEFFRIISVHSSSKGIDAYFVVAPNKATIYPEYMPKHYHVFDQKSNLYLLQESSHDLPFIDVLNELLEHKDYFQDLIYHKKDSHWNQLGAYVAYQRILLDMGLTPLPLDKNKIQKETSWHGDLSVMLYPAFKDLDTQYQLGIEDTFIFTRPIRQFDDLQIESKNVQMSNSIVMFRDSFANALVPLISNSFESAYYYRNFPYDFRLLDTINPDYLLMEIAERNIPWLLQATPILEIQSQPRKTSFTKQVSFDVMFNQSTQSDMNFVNVLFETKEVTRKITAVKLVNETSEYDVFPFYQDDDFQDNTLSHGFSGYFDVSLNIDDVQILVLIDHEWHLLD